MGRREELLEQVADHVLAEGLIGLTLRPVAAAIGTSDRMLIYHFGSRDDLVTAVVAHVGDRAMAAVGALPGAATVWEGVNALWRAYQSPPLRECLGVYVQAAATGLIGREPYLTTVRESNQRWAEALRAYFVRCGAPADRVGRIVLLVDSSLYGFQLDLVTERFEELAKGVDDLAAAADRLATS